MSRFNKMIRYVVAFLLGGSFVTVSAVWSGYVRALEMIPAPGQTATIEIDTQTPWPVTLRIHTKHPGPAILPCDPTAGPVAPPREPVDTGRGATL